MDSLKSIAVFCGSSFGTKDIFQKQAEALGKALLDRNITLVYGGGNRGIMGVIAHTVHDGGGKVIGVLPKSMDIPSVTENTAATEVRVTEGMHDRKKIMYDLSDAFIAMPGGIGTIEEIAEIYTWRQLRYHGKNIGLLNVDGYWNPFLAQLDKAVETGFISQTVRNVLIVSDDPQELLDRLEKERKEVPDKLCDRK